MLVAIFRKIDVQQFNAADLTLQRRTLLATDKYFSSAAAFLLWG